MPHFVCAPALTAGADAASALEASTSSRTLLVKPLDRHRQTLAADEPHGVIGVAVGVSPQAIDRHNSRMFQVSGDLGLEDESRSLGLAMDVAAAESPSPRRRAAAQHPAPAKPAQFPPWHAGGSVEIAVPSSPAKDGAKTRRPIPRESPHPTARVASHPRRGVGNRPRIAFGNLSERVRNQVLSVQSPQAKPRSP